jgi:hypothetical protein
MLYIFGADYLPASQHFRELKTGGSDVFSPVILNSIDAF